MHLTGCYQYTYLSTTRIYYIITLLIIHHVQGWIGSKICDDNNSIICSPGHPLPMAESFTNKGNIKIVICQHVQTPIWLSQWVNIGGTGL